MWRASSATACGPNARRCQARHARKSATRSAVEPARPPWSGISLVHSIRQAGESGPTSASTARARSNRSPQSSSSRGLSIVHSWSEVARTSFGASTRVTRARSLTEHEICEPPYWSVGFPRTPARPGAETTRRRGSGIDPRVPARRSDRKGSGRALARPPGSDERQTVEPGRRWTEDASRSLERVAPPDGFHPLKTQQPCHVLKAVERWAAGDLARRGELIHCRTHPGPRREQRSDVKHELEATGRRLRHRELSVVDEGYALERPGVTLHVPARPDPVHEDKVRTRVVVGSCSAHRFLPAMRCEGVGASDHDKLRVASGGAGCLYLRHHLLQRDHLLAREKTATFRPHLVLKVKACGTGPLILAYGMPDVHRIAVAGVGIADHRHAGRAREHTDILHHLRETKQTYIRKPARSGSPKSRHVHGFKACRRGELRLKTVKHKGRHDQRPNPQELAQARPRRGHGRLTRMRDRPSRPRRAASTKKPVSRSCAIPSSPAGSPERMGRTLRPPGHQAVAPPGALALQPRTSTLSRGAPSRSKHSSPATASICAIR